ncbi:hypothetical protein ACKI1I_14260 [Streptomyces turgidiscabies]|uniref:Uncharacterized protein n=1 Tax=Streptomyces turgidiscabies (strain Car8) TaxID=698760 RepID=L7F8B6_STRT8|nr:MULTISPECIES: hypothetical protein [Streptomyces]ELP66915.1 hypothetical protein STRTUCAR8_06194 [Streptomyces turgidiscabies Car8]MDX3493041.1 hypothetical protein [Streptomyces turgidiscabies]GAQ77224.1 hypothetical protein T45_09040 [Streptomyces turgidiscabies]
MRAEPVSTESTDAPELPHEPRLLPWTGQEGRPCYLITDDHGGPVSRLADATESIQLGMGTELLAHAHELLPDTPRGELRFLAERLTEALRDALRVAESRGQRLNRLN